MCIYTYMYFHFNVYINMCLYVYIHTLIMREKGVQGNKQKIEGKFSVVSSFKVKS